MWRILITALAIVAALGYAVMFATWNMTPVKVVGLRIGQDEYWENVPVAYLPLIGLAIGVIGMAIAAAGAWAGQRAQAKRAEKQIQEAKQLIREQRQKIEELQKEVDSLREQLAAAQAAPAGQGEEGGEEEEEEVI